MIFNPASCSSSGVGLEGLRVKRLCRRVNSSGEFLLEDSMTESEFKQKFILYFQDDIDGGAVFGRSGLCGDRKEYQYLNSSGTTFVANNENFQAFRFSGSEVWCSCYPTDTNPSQEIRMIFIYKDA